MFKNTLATIQRILNDNRKSAPVVSAPEPKQELPTPRKNQKKFRANKYKDISTPKKCMMEVWICEWNKGMEFINSIDTICDTMI
jgi:hypothetical protein